MKEVFAFDGYSNIDRVSYKSITSVAFKRTRKGMSAYIIPTQSLTITGISIDVADMVSLIGGNGTARITVGTTNTDIPVTGWTKTKTTLNLTGQTSISITCLTGHVFVTKVFCYDENLNANQYIKIATYLNNLRLLTEVKKWKGIEKIRKPSNLNEFGLVAAYNDVSFLDIAGSNNGITSNVISTLNGAIFNGLNSKVACGNIGNIKSIAFRIKLNSTSEKILEGAANDLLIFSNAGTLSFSDYDKAYINGIETSAVIANTWLNIVITSSTNVNNTALILALNNLTYGNFEINDLRLYNNELSLQQVKDYHNSFNFPVFTQTYKYEGDGNAAIGSIKETGTYEVQTDSPPLFRSTDVLENIISGESYVTSTTVSTWEFNFKKMDASVTMFYFMSDVSAVTQNGYRFRLSSGEVVYIDRIDSGIPTAILSTTGGYIDINTWYRIKITRDGSGNFALYIKGGSFGFDYVLINTITDNTHSISMYSVLNIDNGDLFSDYIANTISIPVSSFIDGTGTTIVHNNYTLLGDILKKYVCTSAGIEARQSNQAYGTWEFEIEKGNDSNNLNYPFIVDMYDLTNANGYIFNIIGSEAIQLQTRTAGANSVSFMTITDYIKNNTRYSIKIERLAMDGKFTVYIKGGEHGSTYKLVDPTGGLGTNPIIENTHKTSKYSIKEFDLGDIIANERNTSQVKV